MKPRERRDAGEQDLFRSRLDQIINLKHELVKLSHAVSWGSLETGCGEAYTDGPGMPHLPTRLMAGLAILKFTFDLSDEELCARWVENPYFQYFCGKTFFCHALPFDRSSLTRWRQRMGEARLTGLLQEILAIAVKTGAMAPEDTHQVVVDTTVQPKNVMFPHRRQACEPGPRQAGEVGQEQGCCTTPVLCTSGQASADPTAKIRPCQTVRAGGQVFAQAQNLSRPHHPRHHPQDCRQGGTQSRLPAVAAFGRPSS
jgi:hypothetical protein